MDMETIRLFPLDHPHNPSSGNGVFHRDAITSVCEFGKQTVEIAANESGREDIGADVDSIFELNRLVQGCSQTPASPPEGQSRCVYPIPYQSLTR